MIPNRFLSVLRPFRVAAALAVFAVLGACTATPSGYPEGEAWDPYETSNRSIHSFNRGFDRALFRPVSKGYSNFMPDDVEVVISNFSNNLSLPGAIVNNVLQGNMRGAIQDTFRMVVNTTAGLGGTIDVASDMGLPAPTNADFGETLHVWGFAEGAYIELPIFGPSTERDAVGVVVDFFTNPLDYWIEDPETYYRTGAAISKQMSNRGRFSDTIDSILYESADSYAQARSLYLQKRRFELGGSSQGAYTDPYDDPNLQD